MHGFHDHFTLFVANQTSWLSFLDPVHLIEALGDWLLLGLFVIIFCEVSIPIGVLFPGDSLLFTTGLLLATDKIHEPVWLVCVVLALAADLGGHFGYYLGQKAGPGLLKNHKSRWVKPEFIKKSHDFFEKRGGSAIILSRFVAVVRTFASSLAGMSSMSYKRFTFFNFISAILWCPGIVLAGYYLGQIPWVRDHIEWLMLGIVLIVAIALYLEVKRSKAENSSQPSTEDSPLETTKER